MMADHQLEDIEAATSAVDSSRSERWLREFVLSPEEADAVQRWSAELDGDPYDQNFDAYDRLLGERLNGLPRRLLDAVEQFGTPESPGVLRLRGIPVPADLPPTPGVAYAKIRARIGTEPVLLALAKLLGHALSIPLFRNGERVHNIYPMPDDADTQKASSSSTRLELHSEMAFAEEAFRERPPDALAILCLRATDAPPATSFSDMRSVWDSLGPRERSLLQEAEFSFRYSGPDREREFFDLRQPLATLEADGLRLQYDFGMRGVTPQHDRALTTFRDRLAGAVSELTLAAGDIVLIDNRRMVHGRSPMRPGYAGDDRWLQRCFLRLHPTTLVDQI